VHFEELESLLDEVTEVVSFPLGVVDLVSHVEVLGLEEVHDRQNLSVVWHKSFSNSVGAGDEGLQDLKGDRDDLWVTGVQGGLNGDNQLGDDGQHLGATDLEEVEHALNCKESVGVDFLTDTLKENREVMVIIELLSIDLPANFVLRTVLNGDGEITSVVEKSEFTNRDPSAVHSTSLGLLRNRLSLWLVQGSRFSTKSVTLFEDSGSAGSD